MTHCPSFFGHRQRLGRRCWASTWWTTGPVRTCGRPAWSTTPSSGWSGPSHRRRTSLLITSHWAQSSDTGKDKRTHINSPRGSVEMIDRNKHKHPASRGVCRCGVCLRGDAFAYVWVEKLKRCRTSRGEAQLHYSWFPWIFCVQVIVCKWLHRPTPLLSSHLSHTKHLFELMMCVSPKFKFGDRKCRTFNIFPLPLIRRCLVTTLVHFVGCILDFLLLWNVSGGMDRESDVLWCIIEQQWCNVNEPCSDAGQTVCVSVCPWDIDRLSDVDCSHVNSGSRG